MKTEKNTFKRDEFIDMLEFIINSINNKYSLSFNYCIDENRVSFYDELTRSEILAFLYDDNYYCYAFLSDTLLFDIDNNNYSDFLLDIFNSLI